MEKMQDGDFADIQEEVSGQSPAAQSCSAGKSAAEETSAATQKALALLARCEQCRSGLERKLLQKGYSKDTVEGVLDALEERGLLDDLRFARAWLNSRRIGHYEGRTRLLSELAARGIGKETAKKAVDAFFEEFDEEEICARAVKKILSQGKSGEKLMASMIRAGFSFKMSQKAIKNLEENLDSVRDF
ncbi:MAG: RecX family transcriptional regulator [Treponema sp.]|nr:RecX family transcriptional regulator [Treponema sp.]